MSKVTYGSMFAGVGGFDLGFDSAGWDCSWQIEWDKSCQRVLANHWPDVDRYSDICDVDGSTIKPVDVISFGSPCQDLSVAGHRAGLEGSRSSMFFEATRIIKEMRNATGNQYPRIAIWENVPGALTSNKGNDFAAVIDEMANIGALAIEWHVLDAQWFGVPHRRRRVFVIACFDPATVGRCGQQILPVPQDSNGNLKKVRKKRKSTTSNIEESFDKLVRETGGLESDERKLYARTGFSHYSEDNATLNATMHKRPEENFVLHNVSTYVKTIRSGARDADGNLPPEVWAAESVSPTLNAHDNSGESRSTVLIVDGTRVNDVRVYDDGIMPTLKARMGTGGGQVPLVTSVIGFNTKQDPISSLDLSPSLPRNNGELGVAIPNGVDDGYEPELILRRLTPIECERLMGFPDDHTRWGSDGKEVSNTSRYKMLGNAVAVPVVSWIANVLNEYIS